MPKGSAGPPASLLPLI